LMCHPKDLIKKQQQNCSNRKALEMRKLESCYAACFSQ